MVQQQKQVEVVDNVLKQDISSVEIPIQEIITKNIEQEEDKKEEIKTQKSNKTGVTGLEDISKKDKKVSSDHNIKSDETSFPEHEPLEPGHIILTIHKARDIEKKGKFGKADPYVKITLENQNAKSPTVKNNHNPEWNFTAKFDN